MVDDIPEALRDRPLERPTATPSPTPTAAGSPLLLLVATMASVALGGLGWYLWQSPVQVAQTAPSAPDNTASETTDESSSPENPDLLGHLPYQEAAPEDLKSIVSDNTMRIQRPLSGCETMPLTIVLSYRFPPIILRTSPMNPGTGVLSAIAIAWKPSIKPENCLRMGKTRSQIKKKKSH